MSRILEFEPENENDVVSRVLLKVHKSIDDHLPSASDPSRKFRKTVFSDNIEETKIESLSAELLKGGQEEITSASPSALNEKKPADTAYIPPPRARRTQDATPMTDQAQLEYSKVEGFDQPQPMSVLKKALILFLVAFCLAVATAIWLYGAIPHSN